MSIAIESLFDLYNARQYDRCLEQLRLTPAPGLQDGTPQALAYHDLRGRVCYMLGLYDEARACVREGNEAGQAQAMEPLTRALDDALGLLAMTPVPFSTSAWALGKDVLRIGGSISHPFQVHLGHAARVFDANSQTGYTQSVDLLLDAHQMPMLQDGEFDVVCSAHTIEHLVNPLLALEEWRRVLRPGGHILSVIPNKATTFDHRRQLTSLQHLIGDYESKRTDIDWHHVLEFLRERDVDRDVVYKGDRQAHFKHVSEAPKFNVHVHVFDLPLVYVMHEFAGFKTLGCFEADVGIYYFGQKPA